MRRAGLAGAACVLGLALAACSRPVPEAHVAALPDAFDAAVPAIAVDAPPPDAGPITAWTDPAAIDALARSCAYDPTVRGRGPLACASPIEQACVADPCEHEEIGACHGACVSTCAACGGSCVSQCEACKAPCKDDACRRACATSCGQCRQACVTALDRCTTGHCAEEYKACRTRLVSSWIANKCDAVCKPFDACLNACARRDKEGEDCTLTCYEKLPVARTCNANPNLCGEMLYAPERRRLDPKWKAGNCDAVCAKIWSCAATACEKAGCIEPIKHFDACRARTAGASACGATSLLCPEPPE
jgi:hypothetical protein